MPAATKSAATELATTTKRARSARAAQSAAKGSGIAPTASPTADARAHPPPLPPIGSPQRSPASRSARDLFEQANHELAQASTASHLYDRYRGAHMAALHAAAAVVSARTVPVPPGRGRPRSVWDLLYRAAPDLADWAAYFASGATRRAAAEAGLPNAVTVQETTDLLREAGVFLGVVAGTLGLPYQDGLAYAAAEEQQAS